MNFYAVIKRFVDIVISLIALPLLFFPFLLIAIIIKATSPGPAFYLGFRTGLGGKPFKIIKFRTMVVDAEKLGGGTTAFNDPRIFPFGRVLRKYKLDELPQFINVLKGEMSAVGPRPELPQYTDQYHDDELLILSVRPGITDFSSVEFSSLDEIVGAGDADKVYEERVLKKKNQLRIKYVKEQSFLLDIKILFKTLACLFKKIT